MASEPTVIGTAPMDYKEHDSTYEFFIRSSSTLTCAFIVVAVALAIGAFKHSWAIGGIFIVLSIITGFMGMFSKNVSYKPAAGVLVLSLLALLVL